MTVKSDMWFLVSISHGGLHTRINWTGQRTIPTNDRHLSIYLVFVYTCTMEERLQQVEQVRARNSSNSD